MKSILKKDRILVFVALLGLLASLAPLAARTKAEQSNRYYDYILDYSSLRYMASQSTQSEGEWLDRFASLGIRKVTVAEATALGLSGSAGIPIHSMTVKDAMGDFGWESSYPDEVIGWMRASTDVSSNISNANSFMTLSVSATLSPNFDFIAIMSFVHVHRGDGIPIPRFPALALELEPDTSDMRCPNQFTKPQNNLLGTLPPCTSHLSSACCNEISCPSDIKWDVLEN